MSKGTKGALSALFAAAVCALSGTAMAQDVAQERGDVAVSADTSGVGSSRGAVGPLRFNAGFHLGLGGGIKTDPGTIDLAVTPGLQVGADYVVMDYFSIGGELRLAWVKPQDIGLAEFDRRTVFDLDVKPKGRYAFRNIPLEVYGTMPLGLSVIAGDDTVDSDATAGFNLGFGPGATYFFTDRIGVNTEMLGQFRWFSEQDVSARFGQFTWFFNAVFAL